MWLHPHRLAYERLVRRILALPHKPAVILMHHTTYFGTLTVQSAAGLPRFYWSAENDYNVVAGAREEHVRAAVRVRPARLA